MIIRDKRWHDCGTFILLVSGEVTDGLGCLSHTASHLGKAQHPVKNVTVIELLSSTRAAHQVRAGNEA